MYKPSEYIRFAQEIYNNRGVKGTAVEGTSYVYESILRQLNPYMSKESEYVLDKDWNILIILDACRVDLLEEVADEYDFISDPPHNTIYSASSYSKGWMENNFTGDISEKYNNKMKDTIYISGNPFTEEVFNGDEFFELDQVWKYGWDDEKGYMPPNIITDRAIKKFRDTENKNMIVHYMQPHAPFIGENNLGYHINSNHFGDTKSNIKDRTPWELYRDGEITKPELWGSYKNTLRVVLDSLEILLESVDSDDVIISADHANGIGEKGIYGHPRKIPVSAVREVPWVKTKATNNNEYTPQSYDEKDSFNKNDQLEALGYK